MKRGRGQVAHHPLKNPTFHIAKLPKIGLGSPGKQNYPQNPPPPENLSRSSYGNRSIIAKWCCLHKILFLTRIIKLNVFSFLLFKQYSKSVFIILVNQSSDNNNNKKLCRKGPICLECQITVHLFIERASVYVYTMVYCRVFVIKHVRGLSVKFVGNLDKN